MDLEAMLEEARAVAAWRRAESLGTRDAYVKATEQLGKVVDGDSRNVRALVQRGKALRWLGELSDAVRDFESALYADDKNPRVYANLGLSFRLMNRFWEAKVYYSGALEHDQLHVPSLLGFATVANYSGDPETGVKYASAAIDIMEIMGGDQVSFLYGFVVRANAKLRLGHLDEAELDANIALQCDTDDWVVHNVIGDIARLRGDKESAEKKYNDCLKTLGDRDQSAFWMKWLVYTLGIRAERGLKALGVPVETDYEAKAIASRVVPKQVIDSYVV